MNFIEMKGTCLLWLFMEVRIISTAFEKSLHLYTKLEADYLLKEPIIVAFLT